MTGISEMTNDRYHETMAERRALIDKAPSDEIKENPVNRLAARLHPKRQYLKVAKVLDSGAAERVFVLVPDASRGTGECAVFKAGQYLNVYLDIEGMKLGWPFPVASSPQDAEDGCYKLYVTCKEGFLPSVYIFENWKEGSEVEASAPEGLFYYQPIRDAAAVIGLADNEGLAPLVSIAKAITEGDEDFCLTILYKGNAEAGLFCSDAASALSEDDRIRIVPLDPESWLTAEVIKEYFPDDAPCSLFISMSEASYKDAAPEIDRLGLERKYIRKAVFEEIGAPDLMAGYPGTDQSEVRITVTVRDRTVTVTGSVKDTILRTLEKNGVVIPAPCRDATCGLCRSTLVSGKVYIPEKHDHRRLADAKFDCIHPCATFPLTDVEIIAPPGN